MKADIHPEFRKVLFYDTSSDTHFLIGSTVQTNETKEFEGETYPYMTLDVSSASHPFYTGQQMFVDTAGRVDKFQQRLAKTKQAQEKAASFKKRKR